MHAVLTLLRRSLYLSPRRIQIVYVNPVCEAVFHQFPWLRCTCVKNFPTFSRVLKKAASELEPPITEFTVISAKAGIHPYQRVTDTSFPLRYGRNHGFPGHRVFFSILLGVEPKVQR
jgi:hypothetical protein